MCRRRSNVYFCYIFHQYFTGAEFTIDRSHFYSGHRYRISIHAPFGDNPELVCESEFSIASTGIDPLRYSGAHWCKYFTEQGSGDEKINYLVDYFQQPIRDFLEDIRNRGYDVRVTSALRPKERAFLMHYSWQIIGGMTPRDADSAERPQSVDIIWTHPEPDSLKKSKEGAQAMYNTYGLGFRMPSLTSDHIEGRAIDISVSAGPDGIPDNESNDEREERITKLYLELGAIGTNAPHNLLWGGNYSGDKDEVHWYTN